MAICWHRNSDFFSRGPDVVRRLEMAEPQMTDEQIIAKAWAHAQYRDTKQPTLIGQAIVEFVRSLTAEELRALYERAKHLTNK